MWVKRPETAVEEEERSKCQGAEDALYELERALGWGSYVEETVNETDLVNNLNSTNNA